jgi:hypothetical protein
MRDSMHAVKTAQDDSDFFDAMEKAREIVTESVNMMSTFGEGIGGQNAKFTGLPDIKVFAKDITDAMEQGRQFAVQAQLAFPGIGISRKDAKKAAEKTAPLTHFKMPDTDRFAKLGLFIGGAPQTPGLTEAKRTAAATEGTFKALLGLKDITLKGFSGGLGGGNGYAE